MDLISPDGGTILWTIVTFVILAFLLGRFAWKPLLQVLAEREKSVRDSLDQARAARAEAEEILRRNQEVLANARRETGAILDQGKREAEALRSEIVAQARKEAHDVIEKGRTQLQYEQKAAAEALRRQVADLAIRAAERLIERSLDDAKQRELVEGYVKDLGSIHTEGGR